MHAFLPFYADHITAGMVIVMENKQDFVIKNGVLIKYRGPGGDVTIPEGITEIGSYAFDHCTGLASVTIPEGVRSIGEMAFRCCKKLKSIAIPEGVTKID